MKVEKPQKKKILIFTQYFWPEDFRINDLALGISQKGYEVEVITGVPNYPKGRFFQGYSLFKPRVEIYQSIKIYRLPHLPRGSGKISLMLNYFSFFFVSLVSIPFFLNRRYSAVLTVSTSPAFAIAAGAVLAKWKKIPSFTWILDLWPESLQTVGIVRNQVLLDFLRPFFIKLYDLHSVILSQSFGFSRHLEMQGILPEKIVYFPNWAEDIYQALPEKQKIEGLVVLYAGNIGEAQDLPTLLAAAEKLKKNSRVKWIILGDGRLKAWLQNEILVRQLQEVVQFVDRRPQAEMPLWFSRADLLYVSLKADAVMSMTLPGRVQSFMASAKPILAVASGETAKVVEEAKCGYVAGAGQVDKIVGIIERLLVADRKELSQMGENGRTYYEEHFLRQSRFEQMDQLLKQWTDS